MKISVVGYSSFKSAVTAVGSASAVLYCQANGSVFKILALISSSNIYVEADLTTGSTSSTQLISDYPAAVEVAFNVSGEF